MDFLWIVVGGTLLFSSLLAVGSAVSSRGAGRFRIEEEPVDD
jgi:hypothetical protein